MTMNNPSGKRNSLSLCRGPSGLKRAKSNKSDNKWINNVTKTSTPNKVNIDQNDLSTTSIFSQVTFPKEHEQIENDHSHDLKSPENVQIEMPLPYKIQAECSANKVSEKQSLPDNTPWDEETSWLDHFSGTIFDAMDEPHSGFCNESIRTNLHTRDLQEKSPKDICSTQASVEKSSLNALPGIPLSPIVGWSSNTTQKSNSVLATVSLPNTAISIQSDDLDGTRHSGGNRHKQLGLLHTSCTSRINLNISNQTEKQTITSKMMDRFKLNFMNQDFVKPLIMTANSQSLEMALCEAALFNDIDSQLGCTTFFGLPPYVKSLLEKYKGIKELYDWQKECLKLDAIQLRKNLIYSLPTSGGKTLVAEILIWREVLCMEKDVILVLPYVSIVQEKIRTMNNFAVELNFNLEEYSGSKGMFPPKKHRKKHCVYIATIEKAHALINSLLEQKRICELGLVVVDELHMIGDRGGRGCILENLLTKLMFSSRKTMIIGMSATLGNINELQTFLDADVYRGNFRPVELKEYIKLGDVIFSVNPESRTNEEFIKKSRVFDDLHKIYTPEVRQQDPDRITGLVMEVVPQNSCLVFCPTKKNCENVAKLISKIMPPSFKEIRVREKMDVLDALQSEGNGEICPVLVRTIPYGVAYHHSGLTQEERRLIEEAYMSGVLACLCCTSTLAAGVNLPAKRVILRSSYIGTQFLSHSQMKQMIGRAGRAGIDTTGESIIIVQPGDQEKIGNLLREKMEQSKSKLLEDNVKGLKILLLSAVGLQIIKNETDALALVSKTLMHVQKESILKGQSLKVCIMEALQALKQTGLIRCTQLGEQNILDKANSIPGICALEVSKLGRATFKGSVDLDHANQLYEDLKNGLQSLVLNVHLHLLYLVTPYDMVDAILPNPQIYYNAFTSLNSEETAVAAHLGITEACMMMIVVGKKPTILPDINTALLMATTVHLVSRREIPVTPGPYPKPINEQCKFCNKYFVFLSVPTKKSNLQEIEEFWAYEDLLTNFTKQLSHCVNMELIPLMELPNIKKGRARLLYNAGFKDIHAIAKADPEVLVKTIEHMPRKVAMEIVEVAKIILIKKAEELQEEVEDLVALIHE